MNIQVLFTGGTIGSSMQGDYINTDRLAPFRLLSMYEQAEKEAGRSNLLPQFDTAKPYSLLSENLTGHDLNRLIACLSDSIRRDYDGIIVTHGTDTLQYTAAALSLVFEDAGIPIVLVSSNYILDDARANGLVNFTQAVDFIRTAAAEKRTGVYVSYCNYGENPCIHNASALLSHAAYDDKIKSLPPHLSHIAEAKAFLYNTYRGYDIHPAVAAETSTIYFRDPCPVLFSKAMPGQSYPILQPHIKAVLLETYHSGTLCTTGSALSDFVRYAGKKNIPVYVTGIENRTAYESTRQFLNLNLNILPSCSPIYAYMLLWFMTSQ